MLALILLAVDQLCARPSTEVLVHDTHRGLGYDALELGNISGVILYNTSMTSTQFCAWPHWSGLHFEFFHQQETRGKYGTSSFNHAAANDDGILPPKTAERSESLPKTAGIAANSTMKS